MLKSIKLWVRIQTLIWWSEIQNFLQSKRNLWALVILIGLFDLCLIVLVSLLLRTYIQRTHRQAAEVSAAPCIQEALLLGNTIFPIQVVPIQPNGNFALPSSADDQAYLINQDASGYVIALNRTPAAVALAGELRPGDSLRIIHADCSMSAFTILSIEPGKPDVAALGGQSTEGVRVFLPEEAGMPGFTLQAGGKVDLAASIPVTPGPVATSAAAEVAHPLPTCENPFLLVNEARFPIKEIAAGEDGSLEIPSDPPGTAYHVAGTNAYGLQPSTENAALLESLAVGDFFTLTDANCAMVDYQLTETLAGEATIPAAGAPSEAILFILDEGGSQSILVVGSQVTAVEVQPAEPEPSEIEAEISLLNVTQVDAQNVVVDISVNNYGKKAVSLAVKNVSVSLANGEVIKPSRTNPKLPFKISPGKIHEFSFTFPLKLSPGAVFHIFNVEFDLESSQ